MTKQNNSYTSTIINEASLGGSVRCAYNWCSGGCRFNPHQTRQHSFVEIYHEIFSTVIFSLPLIQEGQLSVFGERSTQGLVNRIEDQACPGKMWLDKLMWHFFIGLDDTCIMDFVFSSHIFVSLRPVFQTV